MAVACSDQGFFEAAAMPHKLLYFKEIIPLISMLFCVRLGENSSRLS
jgi:hypothetical protein